MTTKTDCTIYLAINEDGDYAVHADSEADAAEMLNDDYGGAMRRIVKLTVRIAVPTLVEANVDVSNEAGETVTVDAE